MVNATGISNDHSTRPSSHEGFANTFGVTVSEQVTVLPEAGPAGPMEVMGEARAVSTLPNTTQMAKGVSFIVMCVCGCLGVRF